MTSIRRIFLVAALMVCGATSLVHAQSAPANYGGKWLLDTAASKGLPSFYSSVKSHALEIAQAGNSLSVTVLVENTGGGGMRMDLPYKLDGSEVMTTTAMRGPNGEVSIPTKLTAVVTAGGGLHIQLSREMDLGERKQALITDEDWHLSSDGKSLLIHRTDDTPRGKIDAQMVFVKQ